jgi:S1-C subfamily serine protease
MEVCMLSMRSIRSLALSCALATGWAYTPAASAQTTQGPSVDELVDAVVQVKTFINPDGRTIESLGRERQGSGVVISSDGLILTIGYLMVEAHAAEVITNDGRTVTADVVGYDYDSGFGLLRASAFLKVRPMELGKSANLNEGDRVLTIRAGGAEMIRPANVAAKREFAGYWEYLLDEAIFATPPVPDWSGAALVARDGKLAGIGSLIVGDATGKGDGVPANMFVPIDLLPPILGELIAGGRISGPPRPWLGITTDEIKGQLVVRRVTPGGPAATGGVAPGDTIVGVGGEATPTRGTFYRKLWARGTAGVPVPLDVRRAGEQLRIVLQSVNRLNHLKLNSTF